MGRLTRSLRHRNYRLFVGGQFVSLVGTFISRIATAWLVYRLTGSVLLLGLGGFAGQLPTLLIAPFAGVLVDRWDLRRLLVITQVLSMLLALVLGLVTLQGLVTIEWLIVLPVVQGVITAFETPARQTLLVDLVDDREDVANAIAWDASAINGSRIIGPCLAGGLIAAWGEGWCFVVDAISYVFAVVSLLMLRLPRWQAPRVDAHVLCELRTAFDYIVRSPRIRATLIVLGLASAMSIPYAVLMPAFVTTVLHGGPQMLGLLMTATGLGALAGGPYLAGRRTVAGLGRVAMYATVTFGAALIAFAFARTLWMALLVLPVVGAAFMIQTAAINTVLQTVVADRLRGRVMAFHTMAFFGMVPIGSLMAGLAADRIGLSWTIGISGAACVAGGLWLATRIPALRAGVRPVHAVPLLAVNAGSHTS